MVFKNTLHHIKKEHQKEILNNLKKLAKQLVIVDIDDPQNSTLRSKIWNDYYVYFLGDRGDSFLMFDEFTKVIDFENSAKNKLKTGIINTIKGKYFYVSIKS